MGSACPCGLGACVVPLPVCTVYRHSGPAEVGHIRYTQYTRNTVWNGRRSKADGELRDGCSRTARQLFGWTIKNRKAVSKAKKAKKKYIVQWRVPNACGRGRLISRQSERIKRSISSMSTVIVAGSRVDS